MGVDAAKMSGHAQRAPNVASNAQIRQARGQRGGASPGRSSRCARHIPRIVRRAVDIVITLPVHQVERHIGASDQHRARTQQPLDDGRIRRCPAALQRGNAPGVRLSLDPERFLDRDRHAVERTGTVAARERLIRLLGLPQRLIAHLVGEGVELRIVLIDALEHAPRQFDRRDLLRPDRRGSAKGRGEVEVVHAGGRCARGECGQGERSGSQQFTTGHACILAPPLLNWRSNV